MAPGRTAQFDVTTCECKPTHPQGQAEILPRLAAGNRFGDGPDSDILLDLGAASGYLLIVNRHYEGGATMAVRARTSDTRCARLSVDFRQVLQSSVRIKGSVVHTMAMHAHGPAAAPPE